jgi:energy-coupling factor transporter ATP-binding protein EcfA2
VKVSWPVLSGGAATNDALISGAVDYAASGVTPLIMLWAKSHGEYKGVAAVSNAPMFLNTTNPAVKSLKDFSEKDRIALPAVKVSIQAVVLQMAAAQAFGDGNFAKLDPLTVTMKHPDGLAALLSPRSEITGHLTTPPFMYEELADKRVHTVLDSYDVLGGPHTQIVLLSSTAFWKKNPRAFAAVRAALEEASAFIAKNRKGGRRAVSPVDQGQAIPGRGTWRNQSPRYWLCHRAASHCELRGLHGPHWLHQGEASIVEGYLLPRPRGQVASFMDAAAGHPLLAAEDVTITYCSGNRLVTAVSNISFEVQPADRLVLLGPSGCGKSTLLKAVAGFLKPSRGRILLDGRPIQGSSPERLMVFQEFDQLLPWKTLHENVVFALTTTGRAQRREAGEIAMDYLGKVKLLPFAHAYPHALSGGMKQRGAIARCLAMKPAVLLMDEPFRCSRCADPARDAA